jgi:hypothetical protein
MEDVPSGDIPDRFADCKEIVVSRSVKRKKVG